MKKTENLIFFFIFTFIGFLLSSFYRPYIFSNKIKDFGIADIGNNLVYIPGVYFLLQLIFKKPIIGTYKDIVLHALVLICIEILTFFIKGIGTYDFKDIFGLIIGAAITYFIVRLRTQNLVSEE